MTSLANNNTPVNDNFELLNKILEGFDFDDDCAIYVEQTLSFEDNVIICDKDIDTINYFFIINEDKSEPAIF